MYGFSVRGNKGNLLISDEVPIMTQAWKGKLVVTHRPADSARAYGFCQIFYPEPVTSTVPPMVFAVPTGEAYTSAGLGLFCHRGGPGNWTGFCILVVRDVFLQAGGALPIGYDTGWEYKVCGFGLAGDNGYDEYGLRIFDKLGKIAYDSAWPVVKFQGLMSAWELRDFTRHYNVGAYWLPRYNDDGDIDYDYVLAKGRHVWGFGDSTKGVMISSMGNVNTQMDMGHTDQHGSAVLVIGFSGASRSYLEAVAVFGKAQHPGGDVSILRRWNMLTADFTGI